MNATTTWCAYEAGSFGQGAVAFRGDRIVRIVLPGKWSADIAPWTEKSRVTNSFAIGVARELSLFFSGHGQPRDLVGALDFDAVDGMSDFRRRVLRACATIARGGFVTYGELGAMVGMAPGKCGRAIGGVMGWNPFPLVVPCHRVLSAGNRLGNYAGGPQGAPLKRHLLIREGATGFLD